MFFYEGYICPVCKEKFNQTDDIVACPDCGAPHHRHCWNNEGHCVYADDHGTPRQWKRPHDSEQPPVGQTSRPFYGAAGAGNVNTCSRCGKANPQFAEFCSRCGYGLKPPEWSSNDNAQRGGGFYNGYNTPFPGGYGEYMPYHVPITDPFGGVAHGEKINGISAEDYVTYIGNNSAYYLPRFLKLSQGGSRASWNWSAFLFTPYWFLYRKNYLAGGILLFLSLLQTIINNFILAYYIQPALNMSSDRAMFDSMLQLIESGRYSIYFTIITLMFLVNILIRVILGLSGNLLYMRTATARIRRISESTGMSRVLNQDTEQNSEVVHDYRRELAAQGGVSFVLVAVASGVLWFGQMLFQALLVYM